MSSALERLELISSRNRSQDPTTVAAVVVEVEQTWLMGEEVEEEVEKKLDWMELAGRRMRDSMVAVANLPVNPPDRLTSAVEEAY